MVYYDPKSGKYKSGLPLPKKDESNPNEAFKHKKWLEELKSGISSSNTEEQAITKEYVEVQDDNDGAVVEESEVDRELPRWERKGWGRIRDD